MQAGAINVISQGRVEGSKARNEQENRWALTILRWRRCIRLGSLAGGVFNFLVTRCGGRARGRTLDPG